MQKEKRKREREDHSIVTAVMNILAGDKVKIVVGVISYLEVASCH